MAQLPKLISKSKIMLGYQCHKNMYLAVHKKSLIPPVSDELQALFDQGNLVTLEARKRFQSGVLVNNPAFDFVGSLKNTKDLLSRHTPIIFEAAFEYKGCYARADIIKYNELTGRWSVIEVKSTTKVKSEHLDDVGLQVWIMVNAGLPIEKISVMHLNNLCKYPDLNNLFIEEDVTDRLRELHTNISNRLNAIYDNLRNDSVPEIDIGSHCFEPRECQFKDFCWNETGVPEKSVFSIPGLGPKKWELYSKGYLKIEDVPRDELNEKQHRCLEVLKTKKRYINSEKIKDELHNWEFPLVFLDFETINPAIPRYTGTGPFTQVPFQFSVHVLDSLTSDIKHFEFIHEDISDPRKNLIKALIKACGLQGSVVAYYGKFEAGVIQDLEEFSNEFKNELQQIRKRIVDPLPIIRDYVYDSEFKDSYSIKSVAPAILGEEFGYKNMQVADGGAAQRAFEELISDKTETNRKSVLRQALLDYCKKDTYVMVELVKWMYRC